VWLPFSHFGSKGLGDEGKTLISNEYAFALRGESLSKEKERLE
jgi:hypothetical protein